MKKLMRIASIFVGLFFLAWVLAPLPEHTQYKESDWYSYYSYTDVDIKNSPKISNNYIYRYDAPDGGSREMSSILYYDATDASQLVNYLQGLGFSLERTIENGTVEIWQSAQKTDMLFSISQDKQKREIRLTKTTL